MVYSSYPSINGMEFSALATTPPPPGPPSPTPAPTLPTPRVAVYYAGSGIHDITGPVPFIKISETPNTAENGELFSSKLSIILEGKIVQTGNGGISGIIDKIGTLRNLFYGSGDYTTKLYTNTYNSTLSIVCDNQTNFLASGVRILSFNALPSPDNWTKTAGYSVDLEAYVPRLSGNFAIKSASEDWTIEPLGDHEYYINTSISTSGRPEYHNPIIGDINPPPSQTGVPITLSLVSLPQYKISRKLSAVGFPTGIGYSGTFDAYQSAREWVRSRINLTYPVPGTNSYYPSMIFSSQLNNKLSSSQYFLYNHLRNTSFSVDAGSYEVNDTWLALPTGMSFTEDYTVDCSTDSSNVKTVRVQGQIKGLMLDNPLIERSLDDRFMVPTSGTNNINLFSGVVVEPYRDLADGSNTNAGLKPQILDNFTVSSQNKDFNKHKYLNALSGWIYDIKPYLYRRACIVVDSKERNVGPYPYNTFDTTRITTAPNPIFTHERLLNINPVSFSEDHDPRKGTISYTCEFSNKFTFISGVLSENIRINDNGPADVINEAFVLGRRLGPALQNLGSRTSSRKDISIEVTVVPPMSIGGFVLNNKTCPLYTGGAVFSGISGLLNDFKPFSPTRLAGVFGGAGFVNPSGMSYVTSDTTSWDPIRGTFTRNVSWIYQHCKLVYNTLDN